MSAHVQLLSSGAPGRRPALDADPPLVAPAAVRLVDLNEPLRDLRLPRARTGGRYRTLLAVARVCGEPIGSAVIAVEPDGAVSRDRLEDELCRQLHVPRSAIAREGSDPGEHTGDTEKRGGVSTRTGSVSVVVTTCRNPGPLEACVSSILSCSYADFELIVVENRPGSRATRSMLEERFGDDPRVRYVEEPCRGLSRARNAGLAVAGGDVVAFTDDDVIVDEAWLRRLAGAFERSEDIGCVTGLILPLELETDSQLLLEQFMTLSKGFSRQVLRLPAALERHPLLPYTAGVIGSGANTALRSDVASSLGGFDETLGTGTLAAGGEDLDLYIRLLRARCAVAYEPGAIVWHAHPSGMPRLRRQVYRYGVGLGAALAKQLIKGPDRGQLLQAVPAGIRYLLDPVAAKNAGKTSRFPRRLEWLERLGMAVGPVAYVASALGRRRPRPTLRRA